MFLFTNFEIMAVSASKSKVYFFFQETSFRLEDRTALKSFIRKMFKSEGKALASLNIIFCTDPILRDINRRFLSHDYFTDIVTFDLSESEPIEAEIYISADRVRENAHNIGVSFKSELHRVVFHGVLHLCGYGDKMQKEKEQMRSLENAYLKKYGISVPRDTVSG